MKKFVSLLAAAALMAAATMATGASIKGSPHDLSSNGPGFKATNTDQICIFCHTPHNAVKSIPLWNRFDPTTPVGSFVLYSGLGMANVSNKTGMTSDSISLFCMSCHDGSPLGGTMVKNDAIESGTITMASGQSAIPSSNTANLGSNLSTTHPINFAVTLNGQSDLTAITTGKIGNFPLYKSARSTTNSLECSSCHAVHDNAYSPFLRSTMTGSALCLGCHIK